MPNAGTMFEKAKQGSLLRAERWAADHSADAPPAAGKTPSDPGSKEKARRRRVKKREALVGHRTFYLVQVIVAIAVMTFCMAQLVQSQKEKKTYATA
jgi:hypothetical protein